jgi:nuclear cap-binding protein subunit 2
MFIAYCSMSKTPCGFCFVEFYSRQIAIDCLNFLSGSVVDGNIVRCELDAGFKPGRQFGRGKNGGQIRDDPHAKNFTGGKRKSWGDRERDDRKSDNRDRDYGRVVKRFAGGGGNEGRPHQQIKTDRDPVWSSV